MSMGTRSCRHSVQLLSSVQYLLKSCCDRARDRPLLTVHVFCRTSMMRTCLSGSPPPLSASSTWPQGTAKCWASRACTLSAAPLLMASSCSFLGSNAPSPTPSQLVDSREFTRSGTGAPSPALPRPEHTRNLVKPGIGVVGLCHQSPEHGLLSPSGHCHTLSQGRSELLRKRTANHASPYGRRESFGRITPSGMTPQQTSQIFS